MNLEEITVNKLFKEKITIKQYKKGYRFSIDSPILAKFVYDDKYFTNNYSKKEIKKEIKKTYLEIGTGSGIIPIIMSFYDKKYQSIKKIYAIELQESLYKIAKENIEVNEVSNIELINEDINNIKKFIEANLIDVVFSNPPFFEISKARVNPNNEKFIARHEEFLKLEQVIKISNYLLKANGKLKLIYPIEKLTKILINLEKFSFGLSKLVTIYPKKGENARLVLIEAIKGKKQIETKVLPPVYINKNDKDYSDFVNKILDL